MSTNKLYWFGVQPTSYNYSFFKELKKSTHFSLKVIYSLSSFDGLPYTQKYFDDNDIFINEKRGIDWSLLSFIFTKNSRLIFAGWDNRTKFTLIILSIILFKPFYIVTDSINKEAYLNKSLTTKIKIFILKKAKLIFTTGKMGVSNLESIGIAKEKILDLPYVNNIPEYFKPYSEKNRTTFNIIVLARLVHYKGIDLVIESLKNLKFDNFHLYIGGVGELRNDLEKQVNTLNLEDKVTFCGFLDGIQLEELQQKGHVLVHVPRGHEPFGLIIIDAMARGIPVISNANAGAAFDRIEHYKNGLLLDESTPNNIADAITYCAQNHDKAEAFSLNARRKAMEWPISRAVSLIESYF